jgi:hypothetical protein
VAGFGPPNVVRAKADFAREGDKDKSLIGPRTNFNLPSSGI